MSDNNPLGRVGREPEGRGRPAGRLFSAFARGRPLFKREVDSGGRRRPLRGAWNRPVVRRSRVFRISPPVASWRVVCASAVARIGNHIVSVISRDPFQELFHD